MLPQRYPLGRVCRSLPAAVAWSSPAGKLQVLPVRVSDGGAEPCGSHHALSALATSDGLALVPPDVEKVRAGDLVKVLMLR
jgi:molybdopterin molybdotransferase